MKYFTHLESPVGPLLLLSDGAALTGLYFEERHYPPVLPDDAIEDGEVEPFPAARRQLEAYFRGENPTFDLALSYSGTPFQQRVWDRLRAIPFGEVATYLELAKEMGRPSSSRAVGGAIARNPISIVIPCHRVIGSDGSLTGFGGGLDRKVSLLALESRPARSNGINRKPVRSTNPQDLR